MSETGNVGHVRRTLSEEILQVFHRRLSDLIVRRIRSDERKHIVCKNIGVCIRAGSKVEIS